MAGYTAEPLPVDDDAKSLVTSINGIDEATSPISFEPEEDFAHADMPYLDNFQASESEFGAVPESLPEATVPAAPVTPLEKPKGLNLGDSVIKGFGSRHRVLDMQKKLAARLRDKTPALDRSIRHESMELGTTPVPPPATPNLADNVREDFKKREAVYKRKKAAGTLDIHEVVEWLQVEARENARLRKKAAEEFEEEQSDPEQSSAGLFTSGAKHSRHHGSDQDVDVAIDRPRKKHKSRQKRDDKTKSGKKEGRREKQKNKGKNKTRGGPNLANVSSIYGTNLFKDTQRNADLPAQPVFNKRRKDDALKQLIASVPAENRKIASADRKFLEEATKAFNGVGSCYPSEDGSGHWILKGMKSTLKHYQVLGTAFMRRREQEEHEPRGGILADEMGLGKTVMMLANIVNGRPRTNSTTKCTLIVATPDLCTQWYSEIAKHCENRLENRQHGLESWVQHRAGHRISTDNDRVKEVISNADICLTTYAEIRKSYPSAQVPITLTTAKQKDEWWKAYFEQTKGIFHQIKFFRIVLDEAQIIKNHTGHTSLACRAVVAHHHWAISGTPIMNRLSEFYPYFKFLKEPNTGTFKIFKENFCSPDDPDGTGKLAVFLRKIMIRRTHLDTLFGARLLDLPQPKQHVVWLSFNETERAIYEIVKNRFVQRINTIAQGDGLVNKYNHIWTMLLRLRQLCAHMLLIQGTICDLLMREDFEKLNNLALHTGHSEDGAAVLVHLRNVLSQNLANETVEAGAAGTGHVISASETAPINIKDYMDRMDFADAGRSHGLRYNFEKYIKALADSDRYGEIMERSTCCACRQMPEEPQVTSCFHIYCLQCVADLQHHAARRGRDMAICHECGTEYTSVQPCKIGPSEITDSTASASQDYDETSTGRKKKKKAADDWIGLKGEVLPSTKTIAVKAQILSWIRENPRVKIIVYTQFIPIVRILAKICQTERWGHVKYTGDMSQESRRLALECFAENPDTNVMLASLRCGGLGLNLTMATRVILIDPWWNSAVEQQAFCRVFRIGQTEETRMTRFVIENTIDAAMMAMKERKEKEIDEVMENPRLKERLSVEELMEMFGDVRQDGNGKPFIIADVDEDDEDGEGMEEHFRYRGGDDDEDDGMGNEL